MFFDNYFILLDYSLCFWGSQVLYWWYLISFVFFVGGFFFHAVKNPSVSKEGKCMFRFAVACICEVGEYLNLDEFIRENWKYTSTKWLIFWTLYHWCRIIICCLDDIGTASMNCSLCGGLIAAKIGWHYSVVVFIKHVIKH